MDTRINSLKDWRAYLSHCARSQGPSYANNKIETCLGENAYKNQFLSGMKEAFESSSVSESRRLLHVVQALGDAGYFLPMEALFQMGLPRKDFIVKCNLSHGRLGDGLNQMMYYIHAMESLNLVLIANPYGLTQKSVLLSSSCEFDADLFMIDMNTPVSDYLISEARSCSFDRNLLFKYSSQLLCGLKELKSLADLKQQLNNTVVVHIRSGDGLFLGTNMFLPPLDYYMSAIKESGCNKVIVVAEPFYEGKDPFASPVPSLIASECEKEGVECLIQSSDVLAADVAVLFYAKRVVASNSSLSKLVPLYGDSCESLTIPDLLSSGDQWLQDECITYIDCWQGFDKSRWKDSLDYRLAWVSGEV